VRPGGFSIVRAGTTRNRIPEPAVEGQASRVGDTRWQPWHDQQGV